MTWGRLKKEFNSIAATVRQVYLEIKQTKPLEYGDFFDNPKTKWTAEDNSAATSSLKCRHVCNEIRSILHVKAQLNEYLSSYVKKGITKIHTAAHKGALLSPMLGSFHVEIKEPIRTDERIILKNMMINELNYQLDTNINHYANAIVFFADTATLLNDLYRNALEHCAPFLREHKLYPPFIFLVITSEKSELLNPETKLLVPVLHSMIISKELIAKLDEKLLWEKIVVNMIVPCYEILAKNGGLITEEALPLINQLTEEQLEEQKEEEELEEEEEEEQQQGEEEYARNFRAKV